MGRLLPGSGLQRGRSPRWMHYLWQLAYKWARFSSPEQAAVLGRSPGTSASSTSPGATGGCSATATAAPTCTSSPGPGSSDTRWSSSGASPDDPALADYWAGRRRKTTPADRQRPACGSSSPGRSLSRSAGTGSCPSPTGHRAHASGNTGKLATRKTIVRSSRGRRHAGRDRTPSHTRPLPRTAPHKQAQHFCPPASLQGLLEPDAGESC